MGYRQVVWCVLLGSGLLSTSFADTLTLKDGRVVNGTYLGGSARQIRMEADNSIQTFEIDRVLSIQFGSNSPSSEAPVAESAPPPRRDRDNVLRPDSSTVAAAAAAGLGERQGARSPPALHDPFCTQFLHLGCTLP